jgi:hypothetical protein
VRVKDFLVTMPTTVAERVELVAGRLGLSAAALLKRLGRGKNAMVDWKRGVEMPVGVLRELRELALAEGVDIDLHWLLTGVGAMERTDAARTLQAVRDVLAAPLAGQRSGPAGSDAAPVVESARSHESGGAAPGRTRPGGNAG